MIDHGFRQDVFSDKDYEFLGGSVLNPKGDWTPYLPKKEMQASRFETYACVSFTVLNCIEILIRRQFGEEINLSDRFLAVASETKGGNTPRKVCNTLRKMGVCREEEYPYPDTYEEFFRDIPKDIKDKAKRFKKTYKVTYWTVKQKDIKKALQSSPLLVSVPAWYQRDGVFYRPDGVKDNHATTLIQENTVFDTYDQALKTIDLEHTVIKAFKIEKRKSFWDILKSAIKLDLKPSTK